LKYFKRKVFKPEEARVLSDAIAKGFWKNPNKRLDNIRLLSVELSKVNNVSPPTVILVDSIPSSQYDLVAKCIILNTPSLVSFLHQFVFHKFNGYVPPAFFEDYARAYALGLFYTCAPQSFKKAAKEGKLIHVDPEDKDI